MLHRLFVAGGGLLALLVLASPALAIRVHTRVEGAHTTIWGASGPLVQPVVGTFMPPDGSEVVTTKPTPFGALERASRRGEFYYHVTATSFGPYVDRIARLAAGGSAGWVFKVNNVSPPVGADSFQLQAGDHVLWYWAEFGLSGGPKTLGTVRAAPGCFRAVAYDDNGNRSRPRNVTFRINGHGRVSESGRICPSPSWQTLRATKEGMVRSGVRTH